MPFTRHWPLTDFAGVFSGPCFRPLLLASPCCCPWGLSSSREGPGAEELIPEGPGVDGDEGGGSLGPEARTDRRAVKTEPGEPTGKPNGGASRAKAGDGRLVWLGVGRPIGAGGGRLAGAGGGRLAGAGGSARGGRDEVERFLCRTLACPVVSST